MHPNICSFAKGVLETVMEKDYEGIILTPVATVSAAV